MSCTPGVEAGTSGDEPTKQSAAAFISCRQICQRLKIKALKSQLILFVQISKSQVLTYCKPALFCWSG